MGEDIPALIREFGGQKKIFFVHIRDISGTPDEFRENLSRQWSYRHIQDDATLSRSGIYGAFKSEHVPTMAGEDNQHIGYEMKGNLFGIGYIIGLMHACGIETN